MIRKSYHSNNTNMDLDSPVDEKVLNCYESRRPEHHTTAKKHIKFWQDVSGLAPIVISVVPKDRNYS